MNLRFFRLAVIGLAAIAIETACTPSATAPPVDTLATAVAQAASDLLTQTAAASSPTPPPPTLTSIPSATETATIEPTSAAPKSPVIVNYAPCWFGPGPKYQLESNISQGKKVELLGVGSVPGWYIIMNPYFHQACWVQAVDISIDPATDLSTYPVMTPRP